MHFIEWVPILCILTIITLIPSYVIGVAIMKSRSKKVISEIKKQVLKELKDE